MPRPTLRPRLLLAFCAACLLGLPATSQAQDAAEVAATSAKDRSRLTLERLYSLPHLIGTAPKGFAWSGDGRHLAFLWNDEGREFRDLWVVDTEDPQLVPERLTRLPQPEPAIVNDSALGPDPVAQAAARTRADRAPGVTSVIWHPRSDQWVIGFAGDLWTVSRTAPLRRLLETPAPEMQAFSPDGKWLAFLREGDLWTLEVTADGSRSEAKRRSEAKQRTSIAQSSTPEDDGRPAITVARFAWSPDSQAILISEQDLSGVTRRGIPDYLTEETSLGMTYRAYPGEEPVRQRLGLVAIQGADQPIRWLSLDDSPPDQLLGFAWSPDGRRIAVDTSDLYAKDRKIFVVDASTLASQLLVREHDPENETFYFWRIAWATDSKLLYFLSDRQEDYHVYAVSPEITASGTPQPRRLTRGAWAVAAMHPVDGGLVIVGNLGHAEERQLFRLDNDGELVRLSQRPGTHTPVVSPDGRHAAVAFSSDDTPPDLFLTALDAERGERSERRVTHSPTEEFDSYRWVQPKYVTFPSHVDGTILHGRLTLPPDFEEGRRTYPAILGSVYTESVRNQWGGRTAHPTWGLDQFLAQEGYVLLNVDMRGSWGRGRDHRRGIRLDYGGMDIEDLESGVRFLTGLGFVDKDRVGIWGSSYGGLMTAMSLFRKPGLYAAGVAGAPATNVWHALTGQMAVMMRPQDQAAEYADSSPFRHAHGLQDPLMIIHGMRDEVVLFKDSVILVQRLLELDKDVDFVVLPDAGHGWDNEGLAQTRFAFRKLVEHFERHLNDAQR